MGGMGRVYALVLGVLLGTHGAVGIFIEGFHLMGWLNVDLLIDILYLASAAALLRVGLTDSSDRAMRIVLLAVGATQVGLGLLGLGDPTVSGLLPTGLTVIDLMLLFSAGGFAILFALLPRTAAPIETGGSRLA
jgi:hypothetical protein